MTVVGIIPDTHFPFQHPMALQFVKDTFAKWGVKQVVHIGDVVDAHALSFHQHDPNGHSAEDEAALAHKEIARWVRAFPKVKVTIGNHDERLRRQAVASGIPDRYLRTFKEVWDTPEWDWRFEHKIDGVIYTHGTAVSGKDGAFNLASQRRQSTVIGHIHSYAGIKFHANTDTRIFGLNSGCLIDIRRYAFAYGKAFPVRPILGASIVIDGDNPIFEPMKIGRGERYHRSRAKRRRR